MEIPFEKAHFGKKKTLGKYTLEKIHFGKINFRTIHPACYQIEQYEIIALEATGTWITNVYMSPLRKV